MKRSEKRRQQVPTAEIIRVSDRIITPPESGGLANKTVQQLAAEAQAERMFTDMMSSGGVDTGRMALELLYFIPRQFRDAYVELFDRGLKGADSDVGESGRRSESVAALGRATGSNSKVDSRRGDVGGSEVRAVKGGGKKFKKYWTIRDERAVELRDRMDKRLRAMAREIQEEIASWDAEKLG